MSLSEAGSRWVRGSVGRLPLAASFNWVVATLRVILFGFLLHSLSAFWLDLGFAFGGFCQMSSSTSGQTGILSSSSSHNFSGLLPCFSTNSDAAVSTSNLVQPGTGVPQRGAGRGRSMQPGACASQKPSVHAVESAVESIDENLVEGGDVLSGISFKKSDRVCVESLEHVDDLAGFDSKLAFEEKLFGYGSISDAAHSCDFLSGCGTHTDAFDDRLHDFSTTFEPGLGLELQPTVSEKTHNALFSHSLLTNFEASSIKMPWEVGIYKDFFSEEPSSECLIPKMPIGDLIDLPLQSEPQEVAEVVADVVTVDLSQPVFASLIACVDDEHFLEKRQSQRDASIGKLLIVLRHCLLASQTGRYIIDLGTEAAQIAGAPDIVSAVVGVRSPSTLLKRANSLLSFLRWVASNGIKEVNPFVESIAWRYMSHLKDVSAPATKGASAMSAFRLDALWRKISPQPLSHSVTQSG